MNHIVDELFLLAAHNTLIALILALFVSALTRVWRNPPAAHVLWLLVLLKLVAPPVMHVDWSALLPVRSPNTDDPSAVHTVQQSARLVTGDSVQSSSRAESDLPRECRESVMVPSSARAASPMWTSSPFSRALAAKLPVIWDRASPGLFLLWVGGAAFCAMIAGIRILRFERLLSDTLPSPERLERIAHNVAAKMGVRRLPRICYVDSVDIPLLWCAGRRPTIVIPMRLFRHLDERAAGMILAHELAHLRRRDHWVRAIEVLVTTICWWNPLAWVIRRQIHDVEDQCCDAWVRRVFPDCEQAYAEVVFETAEMLNFPRTIAALPAASPFFHTLSLKARIEMILQSRFAPRVSVKSALALALFALLVVPSFVPIRTTQAQTGANAESPMPAIATDKGNAPAKTDAAVRSEFPHVVKFEQGATEFLKGDQIEILEVRGTAEKFERGNIYWIRGTYTLASHDKATLAAYTTVSTREHATSVSYKVQTTDVERGKGTFTLFLPMPYDGWPHVSFYGPTNSFGENYFGTGDSVKKPKARPQAAKGALPGIVTYTWTDSNGAQHVERWTANAQEGRLKLVEQTKSGADLAIEGATTSDRTEMPSPEEILGAAPAGSSTTWPFATNVARHRIQIAVEKLADKTDAERNYPLVGPARKRSCHYKCTVSYDKVTHSEWPVPFSHTEPKVVDVVYIDHNHLIRARLPN